ncbi:hypothetical protein BCAR13_1660010 [Paraburkholderia caribensis]|nr:hypothetical protein BCAR13_1660010 [Paraburkholderia caribensis]
MLRGLRFFWFLVFGFGVCCASGLEVFAFARGWLGLLGFSLAFAICLCFRWHPRFVIALHASPLCGAAPTFLCRRVTIQR